MGDQIIALDVPTLWAAYMNNTMGICVNKYALQTISDHDIQTIYQKALELANQNVQKVSNIYKEEDFPIPQGFTEEDINLDAPRLFSDEFWMFYLLEMTIHGMTAYSLGLTTSLRSDVRTFYIEALKGASELYNSSLEIMKSRGLLEREPTIVIPEKVEFANKQSFMAGWLGDHRPLNVIEITSLYFNLKKTYLTKALTLGFSQTAQSKEVKSYMKKIHNLAEKHASLFNSKLHEDFISGSISWDTHVTDSQVAPFSDKLMTVHCMFLLQVAIAYYGIALSSSMRHDLGLDYTTAIAGKLKLAEEGMKMMIEKGWFEQPPHTVDRNELQ